MSEATIDKKDINWKIISNEIKSTYEELICELGRFFQYTKQRRAEFGFKWHEFEHLGVKLFCVDTPESWRVLTNTTGGIYRWEFVDSIGYSISTSPTDDIHHEINTYTADSIEQAIQQFKEKVTKIQTGKDRIKEYY
jgi:hypothetical protein